jgi:hypothetical protein
MSSYDHWKTTNPDDEWLGPEPADPADEELDELDRLQQLKDRLESMRVQEQADERLACGCRGKCDPYAHDTAWDWDGTPDGPDYTRCPQCDEKIYEGGETHKCEEAE